IERVVAASVRFGATFSAGAGSGVSTRADFSSSPRIYQQWRPVPRSMRKYQCLPCGVSFFGSVRQSAAWAACWGRAVHAVPATIPTKRADANFAGTPDIRISTYATLHTTYATHALLTRNLVKELGRSGPQIRRGLGLIEAGIPSPEKPIFAIGWVLTRVR